MPGLKYGLNMKSTVKSILEILSGNIPGGELKDENEIVLFKDGDIFLL